MKIIINTAHQVFGGAIQVALSFIYECRNFPEHEYRVWVGQGVGNSLKKNEFPSNFFFYDFDFGPINFKTIKKIQVTLAPIEAAIRPDVMIATSGPTYYHSKAPQLIGFNLPLILYPESPYLKDLPLKKKIKFFIRNQFHIHYYRRDATAYFAQTEDVNQRVRKTLKTDHVHTVTNTYHSFFLKKDKEFNFLPRKADNEFRFLTVTAYYPHKNLELIPAIAKILEARGINHFRFVLTLKPEEFQQYIKTHPLIINLGPVKPEACPSLYQECDGMFLPTLAECFSASYPEAMVMEKPIITTDLGFARSICGEAALYFKPKNAQDAADKFIELVQNPALIKELVNKGKKQLSKFDNARERARKYLEICEQYAKGR